MIYMFIILWFIYFIWLMKDILKDERIKNLNMDTVTISLGGTLISVFLAISLGILSYLIYYLLIYLVNY